MKSWKTNLLNISTRLLPVNSSITNKSNNEITSLARRKPFNNYSLIYDSFIPNSATANNSNKLFVKLNRKSEGSLLLLKNSNLRAVKSYLLSLNKKSLSSLGIEKLSFLSFKPMSSEKGGKSSGKFIISQYIKSLISWKPNKLSLIKYRGRLNGTFIQYNKYMSYSFNKSTSLIRKNSDKLKNLNISNIYTLLLLFFKSMHCLISKPIIKTTTDKVIIQLFYYLNIPKKKVFRYFSILYIRSIKNKYFLKKIGFKINKFSKPYWIRNNRLGNATKLSIRWRLRKTINRFKNKSTLNKNLLFNLRKFNITKVYLNKFKNILNLISSKFNKAVEFKLIRLHHPYHDSNILINLLSLNFNNKNKKARVAVQKVYNKKAVKNLSDPNLVMKSNIPAFLSGLNIKIAGRLMREPIIPRITTKVFEKGAIATGKVNYLDKATITNKNKKGAYTIKIASAQNFF